MGWYTSPFLCHEGILRPVVLHGAWLRDAVRRMFGVLNCTIHSFVHFGHAPTGDGSAPTTVRPLMRFWRPSPGFLCGVGAQDSSLLQVVEDASVVCAWIGCVLKRNSVAERSHARVGLSSEIGSRVLFGDSTLLEKARRFTIIVLSRVGSAEVLHSTLEKLLVPVPSEREGRIAIFRYTCQIFRYILVTAVSANHMGRKRWWLVLSYHRVPEYDGNTSGDSWMYCSPVALIFTVMHLRIGSERYLSQAH